MIKGIVTGVAGTTTPVSFVTESLLPFARRHLREFIGEHGDEPEVREQLDAMRAGLGNAPDDQTLANQLERGMDETPDSGPLNALLDMVWRRGYERGELQGPVYPDAARKLREWHERCLSLYVYSSCSVQVQKLLFTHSDKGNLSPLFAGHFDAGADARHERASYRRIAEDIGLQGTELLFLSDEPEALDAAQRAGFATRWLIRDTGAEPDPGARHVQIRSFDEVDYWILG